MESFAGDECVLCSFAARDDVRVASTETTHVVAHPVPTMAHELLVIPPHAPTLAGIESGDLGAISDGLGEAVVRLQRALGGPIPFNLVIHTAPVGVDAFHWHAHVYPRLATWGGLEIGAELPIVAADPQETARSMAGS
jgi:galactose-1-phosphate uridylyltransferase